MQPAGRQWDHFHEITLRWLGAIVILGMIVALGAAYLIMGRLRISKGRSGRKVPRFNAFERFSHWLTAVSFVVLGLTGLNITFGKIVLLPMIGPEAFSSLSQAAKYVHNFVSASFVIGLVLIVALWIKDNIPRKVDVDWVKQGGGFIKSKHAPSGRFNAGEKLVFWFALGAGVAVIISGYLLMFPFYVTDIAGMQIAQVVHAVIAVLFVAVIIAHIYIGTLGMEGAFEAMADWRRRPQLGEGASRPLACPAARKRRTAGATLVDASGIKAIAHRVVLWAVTAGSPSPDWLLVTSAEREVPRVQ